MNDLLDDWDNWNPSDDHSKTVKALPSLREFDLPAFSHRNMDMHLPMRPRRDPETCSQATTAAEPGDACFQETNGDTATATVKLEAEDVREMDRAGSDEFTFLAAYPRGNATLTIARESGDLCQIRGLDVDIIGGRCPLLAMAFEESRSGPKFHLDDLPYSVAVPFLRYLYTGSYAPVGFYDDVPTSLLLHVQLFRVANIYSLEELRSHAYVNVLRNCEFGCSSPNKPIDLVASIRFVYHHLPDEERLIDAIINYCVERFLSHGLGQDPDFTGLAYDLRPFHQELCKNCMNRSFENETAAAIIKMPFKPHMPPHIICKDDVIANRRFEDVVYDYWSGCDPEESPRKRKHAETFGLGQQVRLPENSGLLDACSASIDDETASEDDDFLVMRRRRLTLTAAPSPVAAESDSEPEYEKISLPQELVNTGAIDRSGSELYLADADTKSTATILAIRTRHIANDATTVNADDGSDSEWSMV